MLGNNNKIIFCNNCTYPSSSAAPLIFDNNDVCSGCLVSMQKKNINWDERINILKNLTNDHKSDDGYDILIPVSGGKDSYFQTHVATKILGLKPLLVTYYGNNYTEDGEYNLNRMSEVFDVDHIIFKPSTEVLIKMNRLGFRVQGDMNWHAHCGIFTYPIQMAIKYKIPLILWGEHGFMDLGGMHSYKDFIEFTAKFRKEHSLRGYDWYDFTDEGLLKNGNKNFLEGLTKKDLSWAIYPSDDEVFNNGTRGLYLSNYVNWDGDKNAKIIKELYNWRPSTINFERTYRKASNLDDMHENGIHDYLKFVKFGYGRSTDHSTKDIRAGKMTREQGINEIKNRDHIKSKDLVRWLKYVDMNEQEFDSTSDTFRDPRVWWIENNTWFKQNIWGNSSSYGKVNLDQSQRNQYEIK